MTEPDPGTDPRGARPADPRGARPGAELPDDWAVLSVPLDAEPPTLIPTEEDDRHGSGTPGGSVVEPPQSGPPGGRIFSLEDRPAPGLYLAAWLLSLIGAALLFIFVLTGPGLFRVLLGISGVAALALGLSAAAGYQVLSRADRSASRYRGPSPLLCFGLVLAISTVGSTALFALGVDPRRPIGLLAGLLVVAGSYVLVVWLMVVRTHALSWRDMGWPARASLREVLDGVGLAVGVTLPATLGLIFLAALVAILLGVRAPDTVPVPTNGTDALAVALAVSIVAPIGEELFFRGFALTAWLRDLGPRSALVRSALFFAFVHIANIDATTFSEGFRQAILEFTVIFPTGLLLGWLFLRRGIVASIAGHITYNTFQLVLLFIALSSGAAGG